MANKEQKGEGSASVPGTRRKAVPIAMASGPQEYTPGDQEYPAQLTSLADMLHWAQNWARSRSVWPLGYGLACCAIEMIAAASAIIDRKSTRLNSSHPSISHAVFCLYKNMISGTACSSTTSIRPFYLTKPMVEKV